MDDPRGDAIHVDLSLCASGGRIHQQWISQLTFGRNLCRFYRKGMRCYRHNLRHSRSLHDEVVFVIEHSDIIFYELACRRFDLNFVRQQLLVGRLLQQTAALLNLVGQKSLSPQGSRRVTNKDRTWPARA